MVPSHDFDDERHRLREQVAKLQALLDDAGHARVSSQESRDNDLAELQTDNTSLSTALQDQQLETMSKARKLKAAEQALEQHLAEEQARGRREQELQYQLLELQGELASARAAVQTRSQLAEARERSLAERTRERDELRRALEAGRDLRLAANNEQSETRLQGLARFDEALASKEEALSAQARTLQSRELQLAAVESANAELRAELEQLRAQAEDLRRARSGNLSMDEQATHQVAQLEASIGRQAEVAARQLAAQQERHAAELDAVLSAHAQAWAEAQEDRSRAEERLGNELARLRRDLEGERSSRAGEVALALADQSNAVQAEQAALEEELRALLHIKDEQMGELERAKAASDRRLSELLPRQAAHDEELARLRSELSASQEQAATLRRQLSSSGGGESSLREQLDSLQARFEQTCARLEQREIDLLDHEADLRERDTTLHERHLELRSLEGRLHDRNEALRSRDEALRERDQELSALLKELATRTRELHKRDASIGDQAAALASLEDHRRRADEDLRRLGAEVQELRDSLVRRDELLHRQEEEILRLRSEASALREAEEVVQQARQQEEAVQRQTERRRHPGGSMLPPVLKSRYGSERVRRLTRASRAADLLGEADEDELG